MCPSLLTRLSSNCVLEEAEVVAGDVVEAVGRHELKTTTADSTIRNA
jgi:hypothetical protein